MLCTHVQYLRVYVRMYLCMRYSVATVCYNTVYVQYSSHVNDHTVTQRISIVQLCVIVGEGGGGGGTAPLGSPNSKTCWLHQWQGWLVGDLTAHAQPFTKATPSCTYMLHRCGLLGQGRGDYAT